MVVLIACAFLCEKQWLLHDDELSLRFRDAGHLQRNSVQSQRLQRMERHNQQLIFLTAASVNIYLPTHDRVRVSSVFRPFSAGSDWISALSGDGAFRR